MNKEWTKERGKDTILSVQKDNMTITGTAEEILQAMLAMSWDEKETIGGYMYRVSRRVRQLHGHEITTRDPKRFLKELKKVGEIDRLYKEVKE
jgi:hypothetical protein